MSARVRMLVLATSLIVVGCTRGAPPRAPAYEKTHLLRLPAGVKRESLVLSDDGTAWAYVAASDDDRSRMVTVDGPHAAHVEVGRPQFLPHTHRVVYWQVDEDVSGKHYTINADGALVPTPFARPGAFAFSDQGGHWAAIGIEAGASPGEPGPFRVFADGVGFGPYPDANIPAVGRDGHVAYVARDADGVALYVDGAARWRYAAPTAPCAVEAARQAGPVNLPAHHIVRYFGDGSVLVITRDADGWGVYHDDRRLASYPVSNIDPDMEACKASARLAQGSIRKADDAPVAAWYERLAGEQERWRVVRNGAPVDDLICSAPWRQQPPELSADGAHMTYACMQNEGERGGVLIVKDGARYGPYADVWGLALSKNGAHVAFGARRLTDDSTPETRPWAVYVDGEPRTRGYTQVWRPLVSDDGTTLAWEAQNANDPRGVFGIDGREVGEFDAVMWGPELAADDGVAWVIRRGRKLTRVRVPIAAARARRAAERAPGAVFR